MSTNSESRRGRITRSHDETEAFLERVKAEMIEREPKITALTEWLEARKGQNGFGDDFELTFINPRRPS